MLDNMNRSKCNKMSKMVLVFDFSSSFRPSIVTGRGHGSDGTAITFMLLRI
jgi:hypothetical protein